MSTRARAERASALAAARRAGTAPRNVATATSGETVCKECGRPYFRCECPTLDEITRPFPMSRLYRSGVITRPWPKSPWSYQQGFRSFE